MTESNSTEIVRYENAIHEIRNTKKISGNGFSIMLSYFEFDHTLEVETPDESTIIIKLTRTSPTRIESQESP